MRQKSTVVIITAIWLALIISCTKNESRVEQSQNTALNSTVLLDSKTDIDKVFGISADFKSEYKVLKVRDVSTDTTSRFVIDVSLPKNSTKESIEKNLKLAAKEHYERTKANAIQIFGYLEGKSIDATNSVGDLEFAPYGDWGRANEKTSLDKYQAIFKSREPMSQDTEEKDSEMKKALVGNYQAQRNVAFSYSTGAEGHSQNAVIGCAWYMVIIKSKHPQMDSTDTSNKNIYCDQELNSQQLREAEIQANKLLSKIKTSR